MKKPLGFWVATWFGSGLLKDRLRIGGGTWGSLAAIPFCFAGIYLIKNTSIGTILILTWFFNLASVFVCGIFSVPVAEKMLGQRKNWRGKLVKHDQSQIVIDEVWGMMITSTPLLFIQLHHSYWIAMTMVLVLFRIFDVVKLWPANAFDHWENPYGVMLDDGAAGVYAAVVLTCIQKWIHQF